ncbi:hypothetical protein RQP46_005551 [Phenoliferia psychrophenolica]
MEKFSTWRDKATGIAPFMTPLPAATAPTPLPIRILLSPITHILGGVRTALVVLLLGIHFLVVEVLLKICLVVPPVYDISSRIVTAVLIRLVLLLLGFVRSQQNVAFEPAHGDVLIANSSSSVDLLYLAFRHNPTFLLPVSSLGSKASKDSPAKITSWRRSSLWSALRSCGALPERRDNPFAVYASFIEALVYPTPATGFRKRLISLWVLIGVAVLLALVQLALVLVEGRQRGTNVIWIFRRVRRPQGRYIVTNAKLASTLLSIVNLLVLTFYNLDLYHVFLQKGPQNHSFFWWSYFILGFLAQGWVVAWGILQALILTLERDQHVLLSPWFINSMSWNGTPNFADVLPLMNQFDAMESASAWYNRPASVLTIINDGLQVNIASLSLSRVLNRQIRAKTERLRLNGGIHSADSKGSARAAAPKNVADQRAQLVALRKVERDLIFTSSTLLLMTVAGAVACLRIAMLSREGTPKWSWATTEGSLLSVQWIFVPMILLLFILLDGNSLRSNWRRSEENRMVDPHPFPVEPIRINITPRHDLMESDDNRLKTNKRGDKILWPQPSDDPNDPQNWSDTKKNIQLLVLTMASFVPDFSSGIGIAGLFGLAETFDTTTDEINNLTSNWSIFCLGPGGIIAVMLIKRYGRLPILFWSQLIGLGFLIGCAAAPTLHAFAAMRILNALFSTAPQCAGLFTVCDLFPFHLQARKVAPFLLGFMVASKSWRDAYWLGVAYVAIVVLLITFVMEETMYDRDVTPFPPRPTIGLRYRFETLVGITGMKMQKYRCSWWESVTSIFDLVWRPHLLLMLIYVGVTFGFGIGINVTNAVFTGSPPPLGYGFSSYGTSASYATPIVAVILGELAGRYFNDIFRLWTCYLAMPLFVVGFVVLGAAFQKKLSVAALVFGWGIAEFSIMINTRTLGGFAIPYYQVPFSLAHGPLKVFGMEAGVGAALFILIIPLLQIQGASLRHRFSVHH